MQRMLPAFAGRTSRGSRERFGLRLSARSPPAYASTARDRDPRDNAAGGAGVDARELIQRRRMQRDSQNLRVFVDSGALPLSLYCN